METIIDNGLGTNVVLESAAGARWVAPPGRSWSGLVAGVWSHADGASTNAVEISTNAASCHIVIGADQWLVSEGAPLSYWGWTGFTLASGLFLFGYLLSIFSKSAKGWAHID